MSTEVASIFVRIFAQDDGIKQTLQEVQRQTQHVASVIQQHTRSMSEAFRSFGERMRSVGEGMIDTGENLGQALSLPFAAIGAAAIASAQKTQQGAAQWKQFTANIQEIQKALAPLGATLLKVANQYLPTLIKWVQQAVQWFTHLSPTTQKVMVAIGALAIVIPPLIMFMGALIMSLSGVVSAFGVVAGVIGAVSAPVWIVIGAVAALIAIFVVLWKRSATFRSFWLKVWEGIKSAAVVAWNLIKNAVKTGISVIQGIFKAAGQLINGDWRGALQTLWNTAKTYLKGLWNTFNTLLGGLPAKALQWGKNLLSSFINGIKSMFGRLRDIVSEGISIVKNFLGFSSPTKEGPGRYADRWAPNFVDMYAEGLRRGMPKIASVVSGMAYSIGQLAGTKPVAAGGGSGPTYIFYVNGSKVQMDERTLFRIWREAEFLYGG